MAFGVDLGTSNSSIAWSSAGGDVYSLKVRQGPKEPFDSVERSLVRLFPENRAPVVGHTAAGSGAMVDEGSVLVESFKRRFDKARLRQAKLEHVFTPTQEYDPVNQCVKYDSESRWVPLNYDDYSLDEVIEAAGLVFHRLLTATEIDVDPIATGRGRSVLGRLRGRGRTEPTGEPDYVDAGDDELLYVGVPVTFGPTARRRLLRALVASGCFGTKPQAYKEVLRRCRLVYEPLALAATAQLFESQNLLVVDYGGGTLDIALMHVALDGLDRRVTELAIGGLPRAGDHLDAQFRDYLLSRNRKLRNAYDGQIATGAEDKRTADRAFANAKVELSTSESTAMVMFGGLQVRRDDLEQAIGHDVDECVEAIRGTLAGGGLGPTDVGAVVLTGGSSLVPLVQRRVRDVFAHLDDLAFDAGIAADIESARRTLTGVSRGLARFGFLETLETSAPSSFGIVVPGAHDEPVTVLERGAPDVEALEDSPALTIPIEPGSHSFVVYSDLLRTTYCGAIVDLAVPRGATSVEVRLSASRTRFSPAFSVSAKGRELRRFDLEAMTASHLQTWAEGDCEWLPAQVKLPTRPFLVRPLGLGDYVEWRTNGSVRTGQVVRIRDINSVEPEERMIGVDPGPYKIEVALEVDRVVTYGRVAHPHWRVGDVRLA